MGEVLVKLAKQYAKKPLFSIIISTDIAIANIFHDFSGNRNFCIHYFTKKIFKNEDVILARVCTKQAC